MTKLVVGIVNVVRKAADRLDEDPDIAAEADAFLRQEAQHASAHRKHMLALVQRYPEIERCYEDACSAYDTLIEEQPIEFHAAYIANLEATLFHAVPTSQLAKMVWRLWLSQTPYHDPADQPLPGWADTWMGEYERGTDMTSFAGSSAES